MAQTITVTPSTDAKYLAWVSSRPEANSGIGGASPVDLLALPHVTMLRVDHEGSPGGCFLLIDGEFPEVHTILLGNVRGRNAVVAGRLGLEWVRRNKRWPKLYSFSSRREVTTFALCCGFVRGPMVGDTQTLEFTF